MKLKTGKTYYGISRGGFVLAAMPVEVLNIFGDEVVFYVTLVGEDTQPIHPNYKVESTTPECFLEYFNHRNLDAAKSIAARVSALSFDLAHLMIEEKIIPSEGVPEDPQRIPF